MDLPSNLDQITRWLNKIALFSAVASGLSFTLSTFAAYLNHRKYDLQREADSKKAVEMEKLKDSTARALESAATMDEQAKKFSAEAENAKLERERVRQENLKLGLQLESERRARVEIEKRIAPRRLTKEQAEVIQRLAAVSGGAEYELFVGIEVEDGILFAEDIIQALSPAGWRLTHSSRAALYSLQGVNIVVPSRTAISRPAEVLRDAFTKSGLSPQIAEDRQLKSSIRIFIGTKPQP